MADVTWVIDTSSIIDVRRSVENLKKTATFEQMTSLVDADRLVFPKEVLGELERAAEGKSPDAQYQWAKDNEQKATRYAPSFAEVKDVLAVVPRVLDPDKDSVAEEADPYVLAIAVRLRRDGVDARIVTEENKDTPRKVSLRTAAGVLGVPSIPLRAFLDVEKIG